MKDLTNFRITKFDYPFPTEELTVRIWDKMNETETKWAIQLTMKGINDTGDSVMGSWDIFFMDDKLQEKIEDIFNSKKWNELRQEFLDGKKPNACTRCWKEEDSGIVSMRQRFNERYANFPDYTNQNGYNKYYDILCDGNNDGSVNEIKLATVDLIFNNLCYNCNEW